MYLPPNTGHCLVGGELTGCLNFMLPSGSNIVAVAVLPSSSDGRENDLLQTMPNTASKTTPHSAVKSQAAPRSPRMRRARKLSYSVGFTLIDVVDGFPTGIRTLGPACGNASHRTICE